MTYVFDIDGTICTKQCELQGGDYGKAEPLADRINKVNFLYDEGHTIIYMTARGMGRSDNNAAKAIQQFYSFTENQLKKWNCKYHHLFLGKPAADFYVDDKGIKDEDFFTD
tara:strand:- start:1102 stop:1434 length:333 start_codon:yes stop_codon:yes gene_type:complete